MSADYETAVLIRLHSLGDVVLASAAAGHLAGTTGQCCFVTDRAHAPAVRRMGEGVSVIERAAGTGFLHLRGLLEGACGSARDDRPPPVFDLQANLSTRLALLGYRGLRRSFGLDRRARRALLSRRTREEAAGGRRVMRYRASEFLETVGGTGEESSARPFLESGGPDAVAESSTAGRPARAGLVVGSRWPLKGIPGFVLEECCRILRDGHADEVVLVTDPVHAGAAAVVAEDAGRDGVEIAVCDDVDTLIRTIESLDLVVSPDSGPAHLAAALGVPLLVVFTSTDPSLGFWMADPSAYRGPVAYHTSGPLLCRPCHRHGGRECREGHLRCIRGLVPLSVVEAAMELFD